VHKPSAAFFSTPSAFYASPVDGNHPKASLGIRLRHADRPLFGLWPSWRLTILQQIDMVDNSKELPVKWA
jgi:hypothetical protein